MISNSNIAVLQNSTRQTSSFDVSQLRINQQGSQATPNGSRELLVERQAAYRYFASQQTAFSGSSQISGANGDRTLSSTSLVQQTANVLLRGQEAIRVSRAALSGDAGVSGSGSLSVTASRYSFYSMSETRMFAASGSIELDGGETVDFTLSLRQQQSLSYEYSESLKIVERPMTDPLVINFGTAASSLSDSLFEFDLDNDGDSERLARLNSGSGYLVFDRNGNGKVDGGSELFGPQSGSGFAELAAFDDDGNRWIDANDEIFSSLQVWVQTADGSDELRSLEEVGVRALYVDGASDNFTMTNSQGVPLGQVKATGLYLTTDGEVRTVEEIELADQQEVEAPPAEELLANDGGEVGPGGEAMANRIANIRDAIAKLNEIRAQQQAYLDRSQEQDGALRSLEDYMSLIDRLRLELLTRQEERRQAAESYQGVAQPV